MSASMTKMIHPLWLRCCHWVNFFATTGMLLSGWKIYNAAPIFQFNFPEWATLGGWLGGALQWHFAMMWVLLLNGTIYLLLNILNGRLRKKFFPLSWVSFREEFIKAFRGKLKHNDLSQYSMLQKVAYLLVLMDSLILVLSGIILWKSVQFPLLRIFIGGYDSARYVHFFCMSGLVFFILIHLLMVLLVPHTLMIMLRGR